MIKKFKTTEKSVRLIEGENTLAIEVDIGAKKPEIKKEIESKFKVKVTSINSVAICQPFLFFRKIMMKIPATKIKTSGVYANSPFTGEKMTSPIPGWRQLVNPSLR